MKQVFIRTPTGPVTSTNFLESIKPYYHDSLKEASRQLIENGRIDGFEAVELENGDWSITLKHEDKTTGFVLYMSEVDAADEVVRLGAAPKKAQAELVIIDPAGQRERIGGIHPGYWSTDWYTAQVDPLVRPKFLAVIEAIRKNKPSRAYRRNGDGTYTIVIEDDGLPKEMHINCTARWKT